MKSMKKAILLTCIAGSIGSSAQAGKWSDFQNSCSMGMTRATTTVGGWYTDLKNTMAVASNALARAGNGVAKGATFTVKHPVLVGGTALAVTAAYLTHCRSSMAMWQAWINNAKKVTRYMDNADGMPAKKMMYWHINIPNFSTAADIIARKEKIYDDLKSEKGHSDSDHLFIERMTSILDKEKSDLVNYLDALKQCLGECHLVPSLRSAEYLQNNSGAIQLIKSYINRSKENGTFLDVPRQNALALDRQIKNLAARSYVNPFKMIRRWALPCEGAAIDQYWKVYQLLQRLEAFQECLNNKQKELNK